VALSGCLVTYRPTAPRPALGPGVQVDIVSIRGAAHEAEVSIRSQEPTMIGPISWARGDTEPCSSTHSLAVGRKTEGEMAWLPRPFSTERADDVVFVKMSSAEELTQRGLFLDFKSESPQAQGCLRVPLTAAGDETLWRADRRPWSLNLGIRVDNPFSRLEGTGLRFVLAFRALFQLGPVRPFFGVTTGLAGCRGADCPPVTFADDEDEESTGLFGHIGGEVGLERRFPIGSRSLSAAVGGNLSVFGLGAPPDYPGEKTAGVGGPFVSLTMLGSRGDTLPGFSPPTRPWAHGPELYFARQIAFGRGPTESAWVAGLGWRIEGAM
jgi:hypothetical protein